MNRERELNDRAARRRVDGTAKPARMIKEQRVSLPAALGTVFGFCLKDQFRCARTAGQKPVSSQAARAYLRGMVQKAGIEKKISGKR